MLFDSFKKASMLFMRFTDATPVENFLTDVNGRICYQNAKGATLAQNFVKAQIQDERRRGNFLEMVHESYREEAAELLRCASKSQEFVSTELAIKYRKGEPNTEAKAAKLSPLVARSEQLRAEGT